MPPKNILVSLCLNVLYKKICCLKCWFKISGAFKNQIGNQLKTKLPYVTVVSSLSNWRIASANFGHGLHWCAVSLRHFTSALSLIHKICFWAILMIFICDLHMGILLFEPQVIFLLSIKKSVEVRMASATTTEG